MTTTLAPVRSAHIPVAPPVLARPVFALDLFAGGGGASEGLRQAGITVTDCVNHDKTAIATHRLNHQGTAHHRIAVEDVDWRIFGPVEVIWGSPACTWHARAGGRAKPTMGAELMRTAPGAVDRATAFAVIAATEVHRPKVLLMENVPEFAKWPLYLWWLSGLELLGYRVRTLTLNAADFGHAQRRIRLFVVATLPGVDIDLTLPEPVRVPAADILDDLPLEPLSADSYVRDQADEIDPAVSAGVDHLVTYRKNAHARRADSHPLATVSAGGNHHGLVRLDPTGRAMHRMLTNRECARSQGFPDDYLFVGTNKQVKSQIGNAVPVGIARWLGQRAVQAVLAA